MVLMDKKSRDEASRLCRGWCLVILAAVQIGPSETLDVRTYSLYSLQSYSLLLLLLHFLTIHALRDARRRCCAGCSAKSHPSPTFDIVSLDP